MPSRCCAVRARARRWSGAPGGLTRPPPCYACRPPSQAFWRRTWSRSASRTRTSSSSWAPCRGGPGTARCGVRSEVAKAARRRGGSQGRPQRSRPCGSAAHRQTLRDLIHANAKTFREQGEALEQHAKKTVRILVVGHPCNTNAMICRQYAPSIPASNFTALTRLYQLRAQFQVAKRLSEATRGAGAANAEDGIWPVHAADVKNVVTWANHSATVYPDLTRAVWTPPGAAEPMPLPEAVASADAALIQVGAVANAAGHYDAALR